MMSPTSAKRTPTTVIIDIATEERLSGQTDKRGQMDKMMRIITKKPITRKIIPKMKHVIKHVFGEVSIISSSVCLSESSSVTIFTAHSAFSLIVSTFSN